MRLPPIKALYCVIALLSFTSAIWAVGQSAVITLVFPPGARATGLGEAFTGVANDANATYYNPAGLGLDPLSNSWKAYFTDFNAPLTAIASKEKKDFAGSDKIWAGTTQGILRFNGKAWETYERHLIVQGENIQSVARKYISAENENLLKKAIFAIRKINGIDHLHYEQILSYLRSQVSDSILQQKKTTREELLSDMLNLSAIDRNATQIYGTIAARVDSAKADKMSNDIAAILAKKDTQFDDLVELKIPFSIAVDDTVSALLVDSLDRLWVGTRNGLWRYDGTVWTPYTVLDGLPSNRITTMAVNHRGDIAVGTDAGIATNKEGKWSQTGLEDPKLQLFINALAFGRNDQMYIGSNQGLFTKTDSTLTLVDSSNGLLSNSVHAIYIDADNRLWVGGVNGVAIYNGLTWKRYKFPGSTVSSIVQHKSGSVWIGTNNGAISYKQGKAKIGENGKLKEQAPEWRVFHSKNNLKGDDVQGVSLQGKDIWLATDKAINRYAYADRQILLFYEPLLPAFKIPDLWHVYLSGVFATEDFGTLGILVNFINFGSNELTDEQGKYIGIARSWEGVFGISYGLQLAQDLSAGLNIKYAQSQLAPGIGEGDEGIGRTFAVDAGIMKRNLFIKNFDIGFMLQNMGPNIYYIGPDQQDPIPFTVKLGFSYMPVQTPFYDLRLLLDFNREIVKNYSDGRLPDPFYKAIFTSIINEDSVTTLEKIEEVNISAGMEFWYANFLALRLGHLFDYVGKRFELTLGLGLKYGNMNFDWSYIHSPEGFMKGIVADGSNGSRNGQWRSSFIFKF